MKKLFGIIATVLFLISFTAQVAVGQEGNFQNDGTNYDGRILVITDARGQDVTYCGREMVEYKAVVIGPQRGPGIVTTVAITATVVVSPGDRFHITGGAACGDGRLSTELSPRGGD